MRDKTSTTSIMRDVIIALLPATAAGAVFFGWKALLIVAVCVGACVASEFLFNLIAKKKQTVGDLSAIVTGLLLALNLSKNVSIWQCVVGSVFAIIVVKCLFGGIGHNFANPAISARVLLLIAFSGSVAGGAATNFVEVVGGATPLSVIQENIASGSPALGGTPSLFNMFIGNIGGAIGETCVPALILGFIYLLVRRVIKWQTPVIFVGSVFVFAFLYAFATRENLLASLKSDFLSVIVGNLRFALYEILGGGLILGAVFMATDYSTTPINNRGKMVFALGCGIITCLIRFFGDYPEGVSFAILLMNILSPLIEKITAKRPFGGKKNAKK